MTIVIDIDIPATLRRVIEDLQINPDSKEIRQESIKDHGSPCAVVHTIKFDDWENADRTLSMAYGGDLTKSTLIHDEPFSLNLLNETVCKVYGKYKGPFTSTDGYVFFICEGGMSDKDGEGIFVFTSPCFVTIDCTGKLAIKK